MALGTRELTRRAGELFARAFGERATAGGVAPGRVNLVGDHTDYAGGLALPMAIDRTCVVLGRGFGIEDVLGCVGASFTRHFGRVPPVWEVRASGGVEAIAGLV